MSITSEQLLNLLEENALLLRKAQVNLSKCPKQRLTKGYIEGRIKCIEEYWQSFKTAHQELVKCTPKQKRMDIQYFVNEDYYVVEDLYICIQAELNDMLSTNKTNRMETSDSNNLCQPQVKLPRIQLPSFAGDYEQWPTFHDLFFSLVDSNTTLNKVQKLHYLKSTVTGEAEALLRHVNVSENNYELALNILKQRYGNKRLIANSLLKRLFGQRKVSAQTANQLKTLLDTTTECLNSLQNLHVPTETWDPMIVYITVQKLDVETHKSWEEHIYKHDSEALPTWGDLRKFLESKYRALEMVAPTASTSKDIKTVREKSYYVSTTSSSKNCIMCQEEHTLCHCKKFTKLSLEERNDYVKNNNLCFNCLIPGHSALKCRLRMSCRLCKRRHHTLLHQAKNVNQANSAPPQQVNVENNQENTIDKPAELAISSHVATTRSTTLLATALVPVKDNQGHITVLRALIDQGSQANFISERATQLLHVKRTLVKGTITGVGCTHTSVKHAIQLELLSRHDNLFKLQVEAYVMTTRLTSHLPTRSITHTSTTWPHLDGLPLADPIYYQPGRVDMLLGVEVYAQILKCEIIKGPPGSPCAQNTSLGWILFGNVQSENLSEDILVMHHQVNIDNLLQTFWEIETDDKKKLTQEEKKCEKIYNETYRRNEEGRYIVKLPFKHENPEILKENTRQIAMRRLLQLEKRFEINKQLKDNYKRVIEEYLELNHMEEIPVDEVNNPSVYLPHHAVIKDTSETTKVRVVFDASSVGIHGISLNSELLVGPQLQEDMRSLVMRWRLRKVAYVADIEKMYRQILVTKEDTDFQRILWRKEETGSIKDYRLLRVTFGTASAPYLAVKTMRQVAEDEINDCPVAADTIKEDFYMDDLMSGQDSISEAIDTAKQVTSILKKGGFILQKWSSNSTEFMQHFTPAERSNLVKLDITVDGTIRTLGLSWDIGRDLLKYNLNLPSTPRVITKRTLLSEIQTLFDPLGWLTPALIPAKQIIQRLWLQGIGWDDPVDSETKEEWLAIRKGLEHVKDIQLERWLHTKRVHMNSVSIHGYCDASNKAYGAVAYLRVQTEDGEYKTGIIAARSRVAPVKPISLPRLELCGAVLLSQLLKQISQATRIPITQIYAWTDSTIVLSWLQGDPARWQTFVRNRVVTILENIGNKWYHVLSEENPADIASRGMFLPDLKNCSLWWHGPVWLKRKEIKLNKLINKLSTDLETRKIKVANVGVEENIETKKGVIQFEDYNTISELLRSITYCKRFLNYKRNKNLQGEIEATYCTTEELERALEICVQLVQTEEFDTDISELRKNGVVTKKSKIKSLNPYLDEKNILRVGGRLSQAHLETNTKHPIILGHQNGLITLLIADAHKRTLHGGIQLMMSYLRTRYWIIRMKSLVTTYLHKCIICARQKATHNIQLMGDLPKVRVTPARPFLHTGVDYAGPLQILMSRGRGARCSKGYICIFVCMSTKAIHLELVADLSTNTFLNAFRRFVSRRGKCSHIWSDRGTNFVGANKELFDLWRAANLDIPGDLPNLLAEEGTQWHFNPPYSPNFGGLWEAGVKSVKYHLRRVLNTNLTYEDMSTILCQIEACLNSRPLCPIDSDSENSDVLTPGHFLIGEAPITIPEPNLADVNVNRLSRWQHIQQLVQHFWKRWQTEYLSRLQQRPKWQRLKNELEVGDIVLIKEENLPPGKWALGRITQKHPGNDNICRVYSLRCRNNVIKRPITKLCKLPIDNSD